MFAGTHRRVAGVTSVPQKPLITTRFSVAWYCLKLTLYKVSKMKITESKRILLEGSKKLRKDENSGRVTCVET